jgi:hypothetical protein
MSIFRGIRAVMVRTMLDKLWDSHVVARRDDGRVLLYFNRHLMHEMRAPTAMRKLEAGGFDGLAAGRHEPRWCAIHSGDAGWNGPPGDQAVRPA